jgi:hypothetical protein
LEDEGVTGDENVLVDVNDEMYVEVSSVDVSGTVFDANDDEGVSVGVRVVAGVVTEEVIEDVVTVKNGAVPDVESSSTATRLKGLEGGPPERRETSDRKWRCVKVRGTLVRHVRKGSEISGDKLNESTNEPCAVPRALLRHI